MVRPSITHPLRIDDLPLGNGQLGISFCLGKQGESASSAALDRDLDLYLNTAQRWGCGAVLTVIEDHKLEMLSVPKLSEAVKARGVDWRAKVALNDRLQYRYLKLTERHSLNGAIQKWYFQTKLYKS